MRAARNHSSGRARGLSFQQVHDFNHPMIVFFGHYIYSKFFCLSIRKKLNPHGEAKKEYKVGELELFQPYNQLLELVLRKFTRVFFKDGLRDPGRWRIKQHKRGHIVAESFAMLESCWVSTRMLMSEWGGEKRTYPAYHSAFSRPLMPRIYEKYQDSIETAPP